MNRSDNLSIYFAVVMIVLGIGLRTTSACPGPPVITSHEDGDVAFYGAQITLECSGGCPPLTWSGPGSFEPSTGSEVTWTAPTSGTTATVTVTDACSQSDSVTFTLTNVIFVDKDRPGDDGTTWVKAFKHLQDALAVAGSGCEIWVAEATYKPDEDKDNPTGTGSQSGTFTLVAGAAVYGGFAGNEGSRGQRDWVAHETTLSGDIDEDSVLDAQNSRHVVRCTSGTSTTRLDGFTVTMGFSDLGLADGGGIDLVNCSPTIANCLIKDNKAESDDGDGGGMHCLNASPTVTNCVFYSNETESDELTDGGSHGGAIFNTKGEGGSYVGSDPSFINCVIASNLTRKRAGVGGGDGGGAADNDSGTNVTWINCTFYGNTAQDDGGGLATRDGATSTVKNCIFWDNGDELWQGGDPDGTAEVTYSDVEGSASGTGNFNSNPRFVDTSTLAGDDGRFLSNDDGLCLQFNSPCIDRADGAAAAAQDLLGFSRTDIETVQNLGAGNPHYADVGACEAVVEHVIFVSIDGLAGLLLDDLVASDDVPNIERFIEEGLWTYNARDDYDYTETQQNHVCMATARPVEDHGTNDWGHDWDDNYDDTSKTIHSNSSLDYVCSAFDIAHDNGMSTGLYVGKSKLGLIDRSYNGTYGRPDPIGENNGKDKIDVYRYDSDWEADNLMNWLINTDMPAHNFNFTFFHIRGPDSAGHESDWGSAQWKAQVVAADTKLGTIFAMVAATDNTELYGNTVMVVTADHRGVDDGHGTETDPNNYTIPFGVWGQGIPTGDMYTMSDGSRVDPGTSRPTYLDANQPVRHADGVNLGLNLMGVGQIPGSVMKGMKLGTGN